MSMDGPLYSPTLQFELVGGEIPLDSMERRWSFKDMLFNHVHGKIVATDGWKVVCIDPSDGMHHTLYRYREDPTLQSHPSSFWRDSKVFISCIHPTTGDVILGILAPQWDSYITEFFSLNIITEQLSQISLSGLQLTRNLDVISNVAARLVILANEEKFVWVQDEDGYPESVRHFSASGHLLDEIQTQICRMPTISVNNDGIFYSIDNCIRAHFFGDEESVILAGSMNTSFCSSGCADGVGPLARFRNLLQPVVNSRILFVRAEGAERWQWRFACLDLKTLQVQSVRMIGLDHYDLLNYCMSETHMFAVRAIPESEHTSEGYKVQLLSASLNFGDSRPSLVAAIAAVDLTAPVQPMTFLLADDSAGRPVELTVDRRLLVARSEYFQGMLSSGLKEDCQSVVDLSTDSNADKASVSVLIRFVLTDTWEGPDNDADLAFRVRALAHRYRLPKLFHLAEVHLHRLLSSTSVLYFLSRVVDSGGSLEEACWSLMDSHGSAIIDNHAADLDTIIKENAKLAKRLIQWRSNSSGYQWTSWQWTEHDYDDSDDDDDDY